MSAPDPPPPSATVLFSIDGAPILVGRESEDIGATCSCGRVLATGLSHESLWDVALRCVCGRVTDARPLPPDQALPAKQTIRFESGIYRTRGIDLPPGLVLVGSAGWDRYCARLTRILEPTIPPLLLTAEALKALADEVRGLLQPKFDFAWRKYQRGQASRTPPKHTVRPILSIASVLESSERLSRGESALDIQSILELLTFRSLVLRWRGDPIFQSIESSLVAEYPHAVIALVMADFLVRAGNGIAAPTKPEGRIPDLRICIGAGAYAPIELKVPIALQDAPLSIEDDAANAIVAAALKKSGTGKDGQLRGGRTSMLVIGGFHVGDQVLDALSRAAEAHLRNPLPGRESLGAIGLVSFVGMGQDLQQVAGHVFAAPGTVLTGGYAVRLVKNARAREALIQGRAAANGLLTSAGNTREFVIPGQGG